MTVDVARLAKLAQMTVDQKEAVQLSQGFKDTLKAIDLLNRLDTSKLGSSFQVTSLTNVFREDKIDHSRVLTQTQALANAKNSYHGYFVVPAILYET